MKLETLGGKMTTDDALLLVRAELAKARRKFPTWPDDALHAAAVVAEESGELMRAVLQRTYEPDLSDLADVRKEAVQTAAMAIRFLVSLDAYEWKRCAQHEQAGP